MEALESQVRTNDERFLEHDAHNRAISDELRERLTALLEETGRI